MLTCFAQTSNYGRAPTWLLLGSLLCGRRWLGLLPAVCTQCGSGGLASPWLAPLRPRSLAA